MLESRLEDALIQLANARPVFHSEADFQHALAWMLHRENPGADIRLEYPFRSPKGCEYLDLFFREGEDSIAVELKYKTKRLDSSHLNEQYLLRDQGAQDIGRYDFLADVARVERFVAEGRAGAGYAIMLTNDPNYWRQSTRASTVDEAFRLHEGRIVSGSLTWLSHASAGTTRSRERAIELLHQYSSSWIDYSVVDSTSAGRFRYLSWRVDSIVAPR